MRCRAGRTGWGTWCKSRDRGCQAGFLEGVVLKPGLGKISVLGGRSGEEISGRKESKGRGRDRPRQAGRRRRRAWMRTESVREGLGSARTILLPQTPTKLQPPPPGPMTVSTISCCPLLKPCWPRPPIGPSLTRACTLEPQAILGFQGPDQHHTLSPTSGLMEIRAP